MANGQWELRRQEGIEEQYRILKRKLEDHDGYFRLNDGSWIVTEESGGPVAHVVFQGTAKRGQAWCSPDPVGMSRARLIAATPQMLQALKDLRLNNIGTKEQKRGWDNALTIIERLKGPQ